jgi:HAD superfamily hydrolase (TIGR01509 family)
MSTTRQAEPPNRTTTRLADIQAVVFDMDGLLLDTESLAQRALRAAGLEHDLDLPDSFCHLTIGVPADYREQLLLERYGDRISPATLFGSAASRLQEQIEAGLLTVKAGAREFVSRLRAQAIPYAVATSSSREKARHHLTAAGLTDLFETVVTRDDVQRGKPHPDLFLEAARRLGVPPGNCLALEDSHNGVRAAHAAGMPVIMVPDLLPATDEMKQLCIAVVCDLGVVDAMLAATEPTRPSIAGR